MLQLIADEAMNKVTTSEFVISVHGVKHHVASLLEQLNYVNRTAVALTAVRCGLLTTEPAHSVGFAREAPFKRRGGRGSRPRS